jgi:hypothetical protein
MAVEAITAIDPRDLIGRLQSERVRLDKLRSDRIQAEEAKAKQRAQDKQAELDLLDKANAQRELARTQAAKDADRKQLEAELAELGASRAEARRQADLDWLDKIEANRAAESAFQKRAELARLEGLNAYRVQTERGNTLAPTDRLAVEQVRAPGNTLRAELTQLQSPAIDRIELSEVARGRLEGVVGLQLIQPSSITA